MDDHLQANKEERLMLNTASKLAIFAVAIAAGNLAKAQTYEFTSLSMPGGGSLSANAVNKHGRTVGSAYDSGGVQQAIAWQDGASPTVLTGLGGTSAALAINGTGQAVGYSFDAGFLQQAVRWDGATPTVLRRPDGAGAATAVAINRNAQIAGNVESFLGGPSQALRWVKKKKPTILDNLGGSASVASGINAAGDVVGYIESPNGSGKREPTVWRGTAATVLEAIFETQCCNQAAAISDSGQIVGWSSSGFSTPVRAVVWNGTTPTALQSLSDADNALAVNNRQQAVGVLNAGGVQRAALWDLASGQGIDINTFLTTQEKKAGWVLSSAHGISDQGVIVGVAFNDKTGSFSAFQLTPVSVPGRACHESQQPSAELAMNTDQCAANAH